MSEENTLKVGIIQVNTKRMDLEWNYLNAVKKIRKAAKNGAMIACTPECMLDGYAFDKPEFQEKPESYCIDPESSDYARGFKDLAAELGIYMLIGASIVEKGNPPVYRNGILLYDPKGKEIGRYSKVHSTHGNLEARFFKHGEEFPVFDIKKDGLEAKIGIMICYDRQVPETARILAIKGAQVIFNPSATGNYARGWNTRLLQTRAYENGCFVVSVNHAYPRINGYSIAINPRGKIMTRCYPWQCTRNVNLNLELVEKASKKLKTRRPSVYDDLVDRNLRKD
ncbi:MAG: carbon-nitrogen hydrolase family protein [Candidatus Hodarchaeota archaeon]